MSTGASGTSFDIRSSLVHRLTVGQVHQMVEVGILRDGDLIELVDGLLVRKDQSELGGDPMIHGPRHAATIRRLQMLASRIVSQGWQFSSQLPITLSETSEPEPDLAVLRPNSSDHSGSHPTSAEVLLIIEVADSSLEYDRTVKQHIYAQASIPTYWIVNLRNDTIEVFEEPDSTQGIYAKRTTVNRAGSIRVQLSADVVLAYTVAEILP